MTLTVCTECGKDVSDRAAACPHCGSPLHGKGGPPGRKLGSYGAWIIAVGLAGLIGFIAYIGGTTARRVPTEPALPNPPPVSRTGVPSSDSLTGELASQNQAFSESAPSPRSEDLAVAIYERMRDDISGVWFIYILSNEGDPGVRSFGVPVEQQGQSVSLRMDFNFYNRGGFVTLRGTYEMGLLRAEGTAEFPKDFSGAPDRVLLSLHGGLLPPEGETPPRIDGWIEFEVLADQWGKRQDFRMIKCEYDTPTPFWTWRC